MINIQNGYLHKCMSLKINTHIFYIADYSPIAIEAKELSIYNSYIGTIESKIYIYYGTWVLG